MRLYTTYGSSIKNQIDSVSVSQCNGTLIEAAFLIGLSSGSTPQSVASLTVSDCTLTAPTVLGIAENFGSIALKNVTFTPSQSRAVWNDAVNRISAFLRPSPLTGGGTCIASSLSFENCRLVRESDVEVAAVVLENSATIATLKFNGFTMLDTGSHSPVPALLTFGSGSVGQLVLDSIDSSHMTGAATANRFSNIGAVAGKGVLATGWEFPDAVMADGVPYISANSGLPSIKIAGVVEPYKS